MNILIAAWEKCGLEKVKETFESLGHLAVLYMEKPRNKKQDPRFRSMLRRYVKEENIDVVFSINYYPILSRSCQETNSVYICWCPTLMIEEIPEILLQYEKNYYFLFDRQAVGNLWQAGIRNVSYLPYAFDFPEQLEAESGTGRLLPPGYAAGYMEGLLQIKEYMRQYVENLPADRLLDFQSKYMSMHSLEKRLQSIIKHIMC